MIEAQNKGTDYVKVSLQNEYQINLFTLQLPQKNS
jgi:hypothetical protein